MLQIIQYQKSGEIRVEKLPQPQLREGGVLVQNVYSLISSGTERTSVKTAQASMLGKAKSRPDLAKKVFNSVKREGLLETYKKVQTRLRTFKALGYSSAGFVLESSVPGIRKGDRVACVGGGYASHAEIIYVPKNLVVKIPDNVEFEEASFTGLGTIALHGVHQAEVHLGENVAVIGLGLLGLITIQLLKANGCRVIGLDIDKSNFKLAKELGCDSCVLSNRQAQSKVESFTRGYGTDAVIITAATRSNEPIELSLQFARKKSKVVIVGVVGMNIPRAPFYEKELDLRIACSYGPGRYDSQYEEKGIDYPLGYVRWTEKRNMEAVLDLLSQKKLDFKSLISHRIPIEDGLKAYEIITGKLKIRHRGILIEYPQKEITSAKYPTPQKPTLSDQSREPGLKKSKSTPKKFPPSTKSLISTCQNVVIGFIGAGNFAQSYLIPPLRKLGTRLKGVSTLTPMSAKSAAKKFKFEYCTTNPSELFNDKEINTIFIATRHDSHSKYVIEALKKGKHVFTEKPLAINEKQLNEIKKTYTSKRLPHNQYLAVGFNRRFSPLFWDMKEFFADTLKPFVITYRVNAGFIPLSDWIQDPLQGGRIIGEGCHFIDCMMFITEAKPVSVYAESINSRNVRVKDDDSVNVSIKFSDGSVGNLLYLALGDKSLPKEYCEIYSGGKTAVMNDFVEVTFHQENRRKRRKYSGKKGHREEIENFVNTLMGREDPALSFDSMYYTTLTTFKIMETLQKRLPVFM